ncbi:predicted protein [Plenodomus lingam JN3]|uniref:Predicted protein n=1 Tax=Leptosphaeria maculans (strain JN3 / isolate v23.1.3 / race Av1-4-5-6-7-8) TaxID=985895 RepID=E4ZP58_LEPMJ|nr:predicted protein [Plenodomus lingam JN3]CBX93083.1 predicted protein [Plenodomus lingam JN3]
MVLYQVASTGNSLGTFKRPLAGKTERPVEQFMARFGIHPMSHESQPPTSALELRDFLACARVNRSGARSRTRVQARKKPAGFAIFRTICLVVQPLPCPACVAVDCFAACNTRCRFCLLKAKLTCEWPPQLSHGRVFCALRQLWSMDMDGTQHDMSSPRQESMHSVGVGCMGAVLYSSSTLGIQPPSLSPRPRPDMQDVSFGTEVRLPLGCARSVFCGSNLGTWSRQSGDFLQEGQVSWSE